MVYTSYTPERHTLVVYTPSYTPRGIPWWYTLLYTPERHTLVVNLLYTPERHTLVVNLPIYTREVYPGGRHIPGWCTSLRLEGGIYRVYPYLRLGRRYIQGVPLY